MGIADTVRFLNQFSAGYGDYTTERDTLFADLAFDEVMEAVRSACETWGGDDLEPKVIEQEALRLSLEDRAQLAQKLLLSLDTLSEKERDDAWLTEANRRARELDRGEVQPVPADAVRQKVRALLR